MGFGKSRFAESLSVPLSLFIAVVWMLFHAPQTTHAQSAYPIRSFGTADTIPPDVPTLITPRDGAKINNHSPVFTWSESSDSGGSGIENYRIYIDDEPTFSLPRVKTYTTANTYYTPTLYEGHFFWRVYAKDQAGNQSKWSSVWSVEIDTTVPQSLCLSPEYENEGSVPVTWTASDTAGSGMAYTKLYYRYGSVGPWKNSEGDSAGGTSGTFHFFPPDGDGSYSFQTIATDSADNVESGPFGDGCDSTFYDTQQPTPPSLMSPADSTHTNDISPTLSWSVSLDPSPGSGIHNYRVLIDDEPGFSSPYVKSYYTPGTAYTPTMREGYYYWKVLVRDNADNTSNWSAISEFEIDTTAPQILYNDPSPGRETPWYASDPGKVIDIDFIVGGGSPLKYARYCFSSGAPWHPVFSDDQPADYTHNWGVIWETVDECVVTVTIEVADMAGNVTQHIFEAGKSGFLFRKDTTVPVITCPTAITVATDTGACTARDINLGTATVDDQCDSASVVGHNAPSVFPVGVTAVTWTASDSAGNCISCTQRVTVDDRQEPTISFSVPDRFCWNRPPRTTHLQLRDNCGLSSVWYRFDLGHWIPLFTELTNTSLDYSGWSLPESLFATLPEGSHTIHFRIIDDHGNEGGTSSGSGWTFVKDTTPPDPPQKIISSSHIPGVWSSMNRVEISWVEATETPGDCGLLGHATHWDSVPAGIPVPDTTTAFIAAVIGSTSQRLPEGWSYFHLRSVDVAGNWQSEYQITHVGPFCIDRAKPTCTITACPPGTVEVCHEIEICFEGEDNFCPNDSLEFSHMLVGVDTEPSAWSSHQCVSYIIPEGNHIFWVWVRDQAGNVSPSAECIVMTQSDYCAKGDVNGDCVINVLDVARCATMILDLPPEPSGNELCRADCCEDGLINILDALWIANTILENGMRRPGTKISQPESGRR